MNVLPLLASRLAVPIALVALFLSACGGQPGAVSQPTATSVGTQQSTVPTPTATPAGTPSAQNSIDFIRMIDASNGWASDATQILRTTDGGADWRDVTPAGCRSQPQVGVDSFDALDAAHVWLVCAYGGPIGSQTFAVFRSGDGGQSWQSVTLALAPPDIGVGVTFVDDTHGWLVQGQGSATGHHFMTLYRTTDGGATWQQVTKTDAPGGPSSGGLGGGPVFSSDSTGWIGDESGIYSMGPTQFDLWMTHDGGATWSRQALPPPNAPLMGPTNAPTCFDSQHCLIAITGGTPGSAQPADGQFLVYLTSNGGQTWAAQPLVQIQLSGGLDLIDQQHGWAIVNPNPPGVSICNYAAGSSVLAREVLASPPSPDVLEATIDSGQHWAPLNSTVDWCDLAQLDYVSQLQGWALLSNPSTGATTLMVTTDGGKSWTAIPWRIS